MGRATIYIYNIYIDSSSHKNLTNTNLNTPPVKDVGQDQHPAASFHTSVVFAFEKHNCDVVMF